MIEEAIGRVVEGEELSGELARVVMMEMMEGEATPSQIGSFITAMRMKGESEEELASFLQVMRDKARTVSAPPGAVDLCGTGGDGAGTFNISTTASFVVAGAGVPVAKHGNTSVSSRSGSADVLSSMGVGVDQPPQVVERCIHRVGLGFMYAPVFHRSMKNVQVPRKQVAIRTFFNLLGPMANPAEVDRQLVGVYDPDLVPVMARVLKKMGSSRVMVVNGDGMDEITNTGTTRVAELKDGHIDYFEIIPTDFGLETVDIEHIKGGGPHQNAQIMRSIFEGERSPRTDIVALNSGATLYLAGKADTLEDGVELAFQTIEEGRALAKLNQFLDFMKDVESKKGGDSAGEGSSIDGGGRVRALFKELRESEKGRRVLETFDRKIIERPNILTEVVLNRAVSLLSEDGENEMKRGRRDRSSYSLVERLSGEDHLSVIAEYKPRSPSSDYSPLGAAEMAQVYVDCGASGVSVLVEPDYFGGSSHHFSTVRELIDLPMLYKDFVFSTIQVEEARSLGADAVLLISALLSRQSLDHLIGRCMDLGMDPLVEIHDVQDLRKLKGCGHYESVDMLGVNSRDLQTMEIELKKLQKMRAELPGDKLLVGESGVSSPSDLRYLRGYDAVLIGTMFMSSDRPKESVSAVVQAAKEVVR